MQGYKLRQPVSVYESGKLNMLQEINKVIQYLQLKIVCLLHAMQQGSIGEMFCPTEGLFVLILIHMD